MSCRVHPFPFQVVGVLALGAFIPHYRRRSLADVYFNLLQDIAENPTHCQLDTGVVIDPAYFSMLTKEASFGLDELEKMVQEVNVDPRSTLRSIPALLEQLLELTRRQIGRAHV